MTKKLLVGGFNEFLPEEQNIFNKIKTIIEKNFKLSGFGNIETPAVERNSVLLSKGSEEVSKQIFGLYGLSQKCDSGKKDYSLHFDLTIPLARYIIDHYNEIIFPFKRYQIQKVWRGERQQRGRFKEFYQCDIDVISNKNISIEMESETILSLMLSLVNVLDYLKLNKKLELHLNNRKFIDYIVSHFKLNDVKGEFFGLLDKYYKISNKEFESKILELLGGNRNKMKQILDLFENMKSGKKINIEGVSSNDELFDLYKLYNILNELIEINGLSDKLVIKLDPFIVRGLDYYTGTVFETFIENRYGFGSVCSGGRYDKLVEYISNKHDINISGLRGFGGSIGLTRLFDRLNGVGMLDKIKEKENLVDVLLFNVPGASSLYKNKIASVLRKNGVGTEIYTDADKLSKQFKYVDTKKIPIGIFVGEEEEKNNKVKIKDLEERDVYEIKVEEVVNKIKELLAKNF